MTQAIINLKPKKQSRGRKKRLFILNFMFKSNRTQVARLRVEVAFLKVATMSTELSIIKL